MIEFFVVGPRIGTYFVVELGQSRPPKCKGVGRRDEVGGYPKGVWGREAFDAGLLIRMVADLPMNLAVLIVGTIKRLEDDQYCRVRREVRCMFLFFPLSRDVLDFIGCTVKFGRDELWSCEGIDEFINLPMPRIRSGCTASENSVADRVKLRIGASCVDKFTMISSMFIDKKGSHLSKCRETIGEVT